VVIKHPTAHQLSLHYLVKYKCIKNKKN